MTAEYDCPESNRDLGEGEAGRYELVSFHDGLTLGFVFVLLPFRLWVACDGIIKTYIFSGLIFKYSQSGAIESEAASEATCSLTAQTPCRLKRPGS